MERPRARRTIMWSAAVLYNARVARLLRSKKQGHSPWRVPPGQIKKSDAQTSVASGGLQPAEDAMERRRAVSDGHGRFEPGEEAGA